MRGTSLVILLAASAAWPGLGAAAPIGSGGRLGGTVADGEGSPVGAFELTFAPVDAPGSRPRKVKVDSNGRFLVAFVPSGRYRLETSTSAGFVKSMTYVLRDESGVEQDRQKADSHPARGLPPFRVVTGFRVELGIVMAPKAYGDELARKHELAEASDSLKKATASSDRGDVAGALDEVDAVLAERPEVGEAHYLRGMVLGRLGRFDEAEAALRRAAELSPEQPGVEGALGTVLVQRANALANDGRGGEALALAGEAVDHLDRALVREPGSPALLTNRVAALEAAGRHDDLDGALQALAAAKPGDPGPLLRLARLRFETGKFPEAVAALEAIPRSNRDVAPLIHNLAAERFNAGRTDEAVRLGTLGLEFDPRLAPLHRLLARAHMARGESSEAIASLERFLELAPDDPDAATEREMLRRLEKERR